MRRRASLSACLVAIATTLFAAPVASAEDPPVPASVGFDYAPPGTGHAVNGVEIGGSGSDQCSRRVADRVGPWVCATVGGGGDVSPSVVQNGYCSGNTCWTVYNATSSDMHSSGYYGFGSTTIGYNTYYYEVTMNGGSNTDKPIYINPSRNLSNLIVTGERLYYSSAYPGGNGVNHGASRKFYGPVTAYANTLNYAWPNTGYQYYENTVAVGGVVHEWSWNVPGYSGTWFFFAKSPKMWRQTSGAYYFRYASDLGTDPARGGYNA